MDLLNDVDFNFWEYLGKRAEIATDIKAKQRSQHRINLILFPTRASSIGLFLSALDSPSTMPRISTRKRRKSRQYESEEDSGNRAPTKTRPLKQRKKPKVDPSFIVRESDDEPSLLIKEQDANIRYFEKSGVFSRDIGVQSILCHEVFDTHEEEVEDFPETETTGFEEKVEPPVFTSPFSFLIRAADSDIESEIRGSGRNAILLAGNAAKVSSPMPSPNKSTTTLLSGNATKVSHPMPIVKPLPPTKTPVSRKPDTPANTRPLVVTQTPTGIVVGKAPIVVTKTPAKMLTRREKRKAEREARASEARGLAQKAADLAARAIESPVLSKRLLLSMVFVRTNPRSPPATWPPKGSIIPEGFFWTAYPPLETTLETHMRRYYDLSVKKCQSREQQAFNNDMVTFVRVEAAKFGWKFDVKFTDKALRDRVRCYFKTRIQNSKKRLLTMLKDPTKPANTKALIQHLDMIRNHSNAKVAQKIQQGKGTAGAKIQVSVVHKLQQGTSKTDSKVEGVEQDSRDAAKQVVCTNVF